jgi:hypothetical protein
MNRKKTLMFLLSLGAFASLSCLLSSCDKDDNGSQDILHPATPVVTTPSLNNDVRRGPYETHETTETESAKDAGK